MSHEYTYIMLTKEDLFEFEERLNKKLDNRFIQFADHIDHISDKIYDRVAILVDEKISELARMVKRGFDNCATKEQFERLQLKQNNHDYMIYKNHEPRIENLEDEI